MSALARTAGTLLDRRGHGEEIEVYGLHREITTVAAGHGGALRQVDRAETLGFGVRVLAGGRTGYASTTDLRDTGLAAALDAARGAARLADPDPDARLPDPVGPGREPADLPTAAPLGPAVDLVGDLARRAAALDRRVRGVDTASWREERELVIVLSSRGVRAGFARRSATVELQVVAEDAGFAAGWAGWWGAAGDCDPGAIAHAAVRSALDLLGPQEEVPPGLPLLLAPEVTAPLLAALGRALTGPALAGRGPFRAADTVAAAVVDLVDDGLCADAPAAAPVDAEGVPRQRTPLLAGGRVVGALHATATAPAGTGSTGNALRGSHRSLPGVGPTTLRLAQHGDLRVPEVVHVRDLSGAGAGIRPVTGRVDVGLVAHLSRDGEPAGRLPVLPLSTHLAALWRRVLAVGDDARVVPGYPVLAPSLLLAP